MVGKSKPANYQFTSFCSEKCCVTQYQTLLQFTQNKEATLLYGIVASQVALICNTK